MVGSEKGREMQRIDGTVVHVSVPYTSKKNRSPVGVVIGIVATVLLAPVLIPFWIVSSMFRSTSPKAQSFASHLAVRVVSCSISGKLLAAM